MMAETSSIEWTDATWNPVTGCSVVSPGCTNCYAMRLAGTRLAHHPSRAGLTRDTRAGARSSSAKRGSASKPVWTGEVRLNEQWLDQPLGWRRPRRIFVCAHGDLFAEGVPDAWIDRVFAVMALAPQHTFQVLTKRSARMRDYVTSLVNGRALAPIVHELARDRVRDVLGSPTEVTLARVLENVWLGVSAEDQRRADERIPDLVLTPAAVRFVSAEPLLGPIDLSRVSTFRFRGAEVLDALRGKLSGLFGDPCPTTTPRLSWVIVGGESGPAARPMHPDWARGIRDRCTAAGVPFFFKQWGAWLDADHMFDRIAAGPGQMLVDGEPWTPPRPLNFADAGIVAELAGGALCEHHSDGLTMLRLGKARAGRLLDGRTHDEMPHA
jgi:protein gp37